VIGFEHTQCNDVVSYFILHYSHINNLQHFVKYIDDEFMLQN